MASKTNKPSKSKLEYTDEPEIKEPDELTPDLPPVVSPLRATLATMSPIATLPIPTMKKARSDAQKATTARMRVKLEERRRDLVVIKQEAKETALLQQLELKAHIKDKLKAKQLKTKADEKMRQMMMEVSESEEEEESESEPEEHVPIVRKKQPIKKGGRVCETPIKQLPIGRSPTFALANNGRHPSYTSQEFPSIRFV